MGSATLGFRNKIMNGRIDIAQRGASFAAIATATYTADRWQWNQSGAVVATVTQQADAPSDNEFQNSLRAAVTTADASIAAGDFAMISQTIEGYNVRDLIGKPLVLSFRVRSSKTGTHCVSLRNSGLDRSYVAEYTVSVANTWETKSIAIPAGLITAGTWDWTTGRGVAVGWALACGSTYQTTAAAWQTGNFFGTSSQVNCLDTIGNIFAITGVQLEAGSAASAFEHRDHGDELRRCQRYYQRLWDTVNSSYNMTGYSATGGAVTNPYIFPTQMRSTPVVTKVGTWSVTNASGQPVISSESKFGFVFYALPTVTGNVNWTNSTASTMYVTADAEL